jgi:hypothetical protein
MGGHFEKRQIGRAVKMNIKLALVSAILLPAFSMVFTVANGFTAETPDKGKTLRKLAQAPNVNITIERLAGGPIIYPGISSSIGQNIQGPSVIQVPDWLKKPLGKYYMYFAEHKGDKIKLAYSNAIAGQWKIFDEGTLKLENSTFLTEAPVLTEQQKASLPAMFKKAGITKLGHSFEEEITHPHIASPEVIVDHKNKEILLYFHGLEAVAKQATRLAVSKDGINFTVSSNKNLGATYMRVFHYDGYTYAMTMPGQISRSLDGRTNFENGPRLFDNNLRHFDFYLENNTLYVFYTKVGDTPERIYLSTIDVSKSWGEWIESEPLLVMKPEYKWEGADAPLEPSIRSTAYGHVNQLRDPHILEADGQRYLFYAIAGESGIAVAKINVTTK